MRSHGVLLLGNEFLSKFVAINTKIFLKLPSSILKQKNEAPWLPTYQMESKTGMIHTYLHFALRQTSKFKKSFASIR